jgi:uncharacterized membrane protein
VFGWFTYVSISCFVGVAESSTATELGNEVKRGLDPVVKLKTVEKSTSGKISCSVKVM